MEFLGIGPLELLFIVVIAIVVIGPKDIQRTMRGLGRGLNTLYKSEGWKAFNEVSRELRTLPSRLAKEAEVEELQNTSQEITQAISTTTPSLSAWLSPPDGKANNTAGKPAGAPEPAAQAAEPPAKPAEPRANPAETAPQPEAAAAAEPEAERVIAPEALREAKPADGSTQT